MSREIKLRAFRVKDGTYLTNGLLFKITPTQVLWLKPHHRENFYEVLDEEFIIEQGTGATDDNRTEEFPYGQEIYDGDIVKVEWYDDELIICPIIYSSYRDGFVASERFEDYALNSLGTENDCYGIEVIGNIHNNPELLIK